jgi:LytS/YehU family sensor histidine kinase
MYPVNQVILGGADPLSNPLQDIDTQMQLMETYKNRLQQLKASQNQSIKLIWNDIDNEINSMTEEQKSRLFNNEEYIEIYNQIQSKVQFELLNLVKAKIEGTPEGKELLQRQLSILRKLKIKIVEETNREMELFRKFKEFSVSHPNVTYDEFLKSSL